MKSLILCLLLALPASAAEKLYVKTAPSVSEGLKLSTGPVAAPGSEYASFLWNHSSGLLSISGGNGSGRMGFFTGSGAGTERMSILSGGNVGIGYQVPLHKLDVDGSIRFSSAVLTGNPPYIFADTPDGADTSEISIGGGGGSSVNRGATINMIGNESAVRPGELDLMAGNVVGGTITLQTSGLERMVVMPSGNVGIGTSVPVDLFTIRADNSPTIRLRNATAEALGTGYGLSFNIDGTTTVINNTMNGDLIFRADNSEKVRIMASGNVGIGTTSPSWRLDVQTNVTDWASRFYNASATGYGLYVRAGATTHSALSVEDYLGNALFNVLGNGNVGIGTTIADYKLRVQGDAANTTGVWANISDINLKENIVAISSALATVNQLEGKYFTWKSTAMPSGTKMGFISQEVESVVPAWVKTDSDGYKWLETQGMDALLVEAIKELKTKNDALEARIYALEHP